MPPTARKKRQFTLVSKVSIVDEYLQTSGMTAGAIHRKYNLWPAQFSLWRRDVEQFRQAITEGASQNTHKPGAGRLSLIPQAVQQELVAYFDTSRKAQERVTTAQMVAKYQALSPDTCEGVSLELLSKRVRIVLKNNREVTQRAITHVVQSKRIAQNLERLKSRRICKTGR